MAQRRGKPAGKSRGSHGVPNSEPAMVKIFPDVFPSVSPDKRGFVQRSWTRDMLAYRGAPAGGDVVAL